MVLKKGQHGELQLMRLSGDYLTLKHRGAEGPHRTSSHFHPRSSVTNAKLREIRTHMDRARAALESEMRQVRNLAILTPLNKSTRDSIENDLEPLARRVKQLRLQITRLECEHQVLRADLVAFEEDMTSRSDAQLNMKPKVDETGHLDVAVQEVPGRRPESSSGSYYSAVDDA